MLRAMMKKRLLPGGSTATPRFGSGGSNSEHDEGGGVLHGHLDGIGTTTRDGAGSDGSAAMGRQRHRGSGDGYCSDVNNCRGDWRRIRGTVALLLAGAVTIVCSVRQLAVVAAACTAAATSGATFVSGTAFTSHADAGIPTSPGAVFDRVSASLYLPTTSAPRWADTPSGRVCHGLLPWGGPYPRDSFNAVWDAVRPFVLNESYHPFHEYNPKTDSERDELREFRHWTASLFNFYTHERLQRSQAHPAPVASIRKILRVAHDRVRDPDNHDPVRIAVMGGSVAVGRGSHVTPFPFTGTSGLCRGGCNYVSRLHHLLNAVMFPFEHGNWTFPVFEVINLAAGGTNSEVGAMALRYQLIPQIQRKPPHIVLSSYSANDSKDPDLRKTFQVDQQAFVRAAHKLRPCDDDLPLVILADDYYGWPHAAEIALEQTGSIYKTASIRNVMATVFSNVVRHWHAQDLLRRLDLFGSNFEPHLGMGFHYGHSWALVFNLLAAFHNACAEIVHDGSVGNNDGGAFGENSAMVGDESRNRTRYQLDELPTQHRGPYRSNLRDVHTEWMKNVEAKDLLCQPHTYSEMRESADATGLATPPNPTAPFQTGVCAYAWMANKATPFHEPGAVRRAMQHVLVYNHGWTASGDETPGGPETNARTGWVTTNTTQASFAVEIKDLRQAVTSITVLSMKSYGPDWIDSKLRATVEVDPREGPAVASGELEIDGYHETQTSVNIPHRLLLADGGARVGDTIRVTFELVQGRTFKVSGLAFCQLDDE